MRAYSQKYNQKSMIFFNSNTRWGFLQQPAIFYMSFPAARPSCNRLKWSWSIVLQTFWRSFKNVLWKPTKSIQFHSDFTQLTDCQLSAHRFIVESESQHNTSPGLTHTHTHAHARTLNDSMDTLRKQGKPAGRPAVCSERTTSVKQTADEQRGKWREKPCGRAFVPGARIPPSPQPSIPAACLRGDGGGSRLGGWRPVGGLIAGGWQGICCSLATNCCWNMIKWPLLANMWSCCLSHWMSVLPLLCLFFYLPQLTICLRSDLSSKLNPAYFYFLSFLDLLAAPLHLLPG